MKPEDELMNFYATVTAREEELHWRICELLYSLNDFTQEEKEVLLLVVFNNQEALKKEPYTVIQGLINKGILTEVWKSLRTKSDSQIAFVGRAKSVHKSREGKL